MSRKNLDVRTNALVTKVVFEGTRAVGVEYSRGGGSAHRVRRGRGRAGGGAINSPQLLQLSGVGNPRAAARPRHPGGRRPARRGREPPGPPGGLRAARVHAAGVDAALPREEALPGGRRAVAVPAQRARRHQPLRGGRLRPQQRRRRLPEPDVPLPADRGALRRHRARGRARLPGARRADVLRRPRHLEDHQHRPAQAPGAAVQLPVHRPGPPRVGGGAPRHPEDPRPARAARRSTAASSPPARTCRPTSRSSTGWATTPRRRCTRPAPRRMGTGPTAVVDPLTMRVHGIEGLRVVDASVMPYVTNGNIYAPGDDAGREGGRPHPGNTPLPPDERSRTTATPGEAQVNQRAGAGAVLCQMCFCSWYSCRPVGPSSRPLPERFMPPHSAPGT